jgi:hypothetical protein
MPPIAIPVFGRGVAYCARARDHGSSSCTRLADRGATDPDDV